MRIKEIYINNYRGFHDVHLPLQDVNFLVGENSSGKTSLLKLLDLLTSPNLWFNGQFRNENVDFSYFGDLTDSKNGSRTVICLLHEDEKKSTDASYMFTRLVLQSGKNNQTVISSLGVTRGTKSIEIRKKLNGNGISYKINNKTSFTKNDFKKWCQLEIDAKDFKEYDGRAESYVLNSPYFLISTISRHVSKEGDRLKIPEFFNTYSPTAWIAPIRAKPQQTYDGNIYDYSPEGTHTPYNLRDIYDRSKTKDSASIISALEKFGKDSGLFDSVKSRRYAASGNAPFAIEVVRGAETRYITDVGYGVSQALPIIVSILSNSYETQFRIQQPEVHLHPRAQASLGSLFYDICESRGSGFIVETHSDFTIDRFRQSLASSKKKKKPTAQAIFFEHSNKGNSAYKIPINPNGTYSENQPDSFRRFFLNEEMNNILM